MAYEILGYDHISNTFKSHSGYEAGVTIKYDENYEYYLYKDIKSKFVVKLKNDWIVISDNIGEIIYLDNLDILLIPHPGVKHGLVKPSGLVDGNGNSFKVIISSNNSGQYFLEYDVKSCTFSAAGNRVY